MIEKILFSPFMHQRPKVEKAVIHELSEQIKERKIDSLFFEIGASYSRIRKKLPKGIPFLAMEHRPYHQQHIAIAEKAVMLYKSLKAGIKVSIKKTQRAMDEMDLILHKRNNAIAQNVLQRCYDRNFQKPGIICGIEHWEDLKNIFEKRGYNLKMCEDYLDVIAREEGSCDYAVRNFSVPRLNI